MKLKIKNSQVGLLVQAIGMLETRYDKEGKVALQIKFANKEIAGKVRYNLAKTVSNLRAQKTVLDDEAKKLEKELLFRQKSEGNEALELAIPLQKEFSETMDTLLAQEDEVEIRQVKLADLNIQENDISSSVLGILLGIVIADEELKE